ncbi:MAG: arginine decarboxylase, pyruvoyl-dependent [Thermoplasmatota archaeon]
MIPKELFLTRGKGIHAHRLQSFELALRAAGIETCNLVHVSSIIPPDCKIISKEEGIQKITPGQITFCVLALHRTKRAHQQIGASIGLARPKNRKIHGYIAEHHQNQCSPDEIKKHAEDLSLRMLSTTVGITENKGVGKSEQQRLCFRKNCEIDSIFEYESDTIKDNWTTVIAAAVFLFD